MTSRQACPPTSRTLLTPTPTARAAARRAAAAALEGLEGRALLSNVPFVPKPPISTAADMAHAVYSVDLDRDGDVDVVSASQGDNKVAWYENDGAGNFTTHVIATTATRAGGIFAADVNGDGSIDVLSAAEGGRTTWYRNDGDQNFTARDISPADGSNVVFAADLDKDGDLDVVTDDVAQDSLYWYRNEGSGLTFTPQLIAASVGTVKGVTVADVNKDGNPDVVSASQDSNKVVYYQGNGAGAFTPQVIDTNAVSSRSVVAADLDRDNDVDLVEASFGDDTVAWYENDGGQQFTKHVITSSADGADGVWVADLDNDGDPDVLSSSFLDDRVLWYENTGGAQFTTHGISAGADQAQDVSAADIDKDGDLDVVSASFADDKVAWYQNTGGRLRADVVAVAPAALGNGQQTAALKVTATHLGTADDHEDRLTSLRVRFLPPTGSATLTADQANALIENLKLYRDADANGKFDPAVDTLVQTVDTIALDAGGGQSFALANPADANTYFGAGAPVTFFVVTQLTAAAAAQPVSSFRVSGAEVAAVDRVAAPERQLTAVPGQSATTAPIAASATPTPEPTPTPTPTTPTPTPTTPTPTPTGTSLTATAVAVLPESAVAGLKTKATVKVSVTNSTTASFSGPVAINLFASTDAALDAADQTTASVTKKLKLKVNQTKVVKLTIKQFPAALADGTYRVLAQVTPAGAAPAVAAADGTVNVAAPFYNLSATTAGPAAAARGRIGKARVAILNSGNVTLSQTVAVQLRAIPPGGDLSSSLDLPVAAPVKLKILAKKAKVVTVKFTVPAGFAAGQYILVSAVDTGNAVTETDETDNLSVSATPTQIV